MSQRKKIEELKKVFKNEKKIGEKKKELRIFLLKRIFYPESTGLIMIWIKVVSMLRSNMLTFLKPFLKKRLWFDHKRF